MKLDERHRKVSLLKSESLGIVFLFIGFLMLQSSVVSAIEPIVLGNSKVLFKFNSENGAFMSMEDLSKQKEISNSEQSEDDSPWELEFGRAENLKNLNIKDFSNFSYQYPNAS